MLDFMISSLPVLGGFQLAGIRVAQRLARSRVDFEDLDEPAVEEQGTARGRRELHVVFAGTLPGVHEDGERPAVGIGPPVDLRGALALGALTRFEHLDRAEAIGETGGDVRSNRQIGVVALDCRDDPLGRSGIDDQHGRTARVAVGHGEVVHCGIELPDLDDHVDLTVAIRIRAAGDLLFDPGSVHQILDVDVIQIVGRAGVAAASAEGNAILKGRQVGHARKIEIIVGRDRVAELIREDYRDLWVWATDSEINVGVLKTTQYPEDWVQGPRGQVETKLGSS